MALHSTTMPDTESTWSRRELAKQYRACDMLKVACRVMDVNEPVGRALYRFALRRYYRFGGAGTPRFQSGRQGRAPRA